MRRSPTARLLDDLCRAGVKVTAVGDDRLRLEGPPGVLTPETREALVEHKRELLSLLSWSRWLIEAPLSVFEKAACMIEIVVPGLSETLWFVSGDAQVEVLGREGVRRGRVWTATELRDLVQTPGITDEDAVGIARARMMFNANVVDIRRVDLPDGPDGRDGVPPPLERHPYLTPCPRCQGERFYRREGGVVTCSTCLPPVHPGVVEAWVLGGDDAS